MFNFSRLRHYKNRKLYTVFHDPISQLHVAVQFSRSVMSNSLWPRESQHARPPCPSPTPGVYSNSCPSSWWCHPAISSSVVPLSSCPQSLPASGSFPMSQLFAWGGQSIGISASASVLPMNTQGWSPLGWTGWISLQSKGLSRVFSNTTVQKHQFFGAQLSSQSNSHIHTWPLYRRIHLWTPVLKIESTFCEIKYWDILKSWNICFWCINVHVYKERYVYTKIWHVKENYII